MTFSRQRYLFVHTFTLACLCFLPSGCDGKKDYSDKTNATLNGQIKAGEYLSPDFYLGQTTLKDAITNNPDIEVTGSTHSDDTTDINMAMTGQISFAFTANKLCFANIRMISPRELFRRMKLEPENFMRDYPDCAASTLSSITVSSPFDREDNIFNGQFENGIRLYDTLENVLLKDPSLRQLQAEPSDMIQIQSPNPRTDQVACDHGEEQMCSHIKISGKARAKTDGAFLEFEIDKQSYDGRLVLRKITIFPKR